MPPGPFQPEDLTLLESLKQGNGWLRGILCTLARRGVYLRQQSPERAAAILNALATYPYYKGGQFLFDLLELEDFMLDGPPPEPIPDVLAAGALQRLAAALNEVKQALDGSTEEQPASGVTVTGGALTESLPPLEPGFYLYQDVVLGIWRSIAAQQAG